jgi:hypothetical protein
MRMRRSRIEHDGGTAKCAWAWFVGRFTRKLNGKICSSDLNHRDYAYSNFLYAQNPAFFCEENVTTKLSSTGFYKIFTQVALRKTGRLPQTTRSVACPEHAAPLICMDRQTLLCCVSCLRARLPFFQPRS